MLSDAGRVAGRLTRREYVANLRLVDHLGTAVVFGGRQADVDVDAERFGNFGAQVLAEGAAGDTTGDLAEDEAEGHHVIALGGAGLPPRLGLRDVVAHRVPIEGLLRQ